MSRTYLKQTRNHAGRIASDAVTLDNLLAPSLDPAIAHILARLQYHSRDAVVVAVCGYKTITFMSGCFAHSELLHLIGDKADVLIWSPPIDR